jgi:hypothetical protein
MMKLDLSSEAITRRLQQVAQLRALCLSLANSSVGQQVQKQNPDNPQVQRTAKALGR